MENEEKILTEEEKREERKKKFCYWRKVMFPDEMSVIRFFSMFTIDPGMVFFVLCIVTGTIVNLPLTYLLVDSMLAVWWISEGFKRKKGWEEMKIDRTDVIMKKIEELYAIEAAYRRKKQIMKALEEIKANEKEPWK